MRIATIACMAAVAIVGLSIWTFGDHGNSHSQYAGQQDRSVKALSDKEMKGLMAGEGLGYAKSAELNGWPGPLHILELAEELSLSVEQRSRIEDMRQQMLAEAKPLGQMLIDAERVLDDVFSRTDPRAEDVDEATSQVASIEAKLRAVHLKTHLLSAPLLSEEQRRIYQRERGYSGHSGH